MATSAPFTGVGVALATLFDDDGGLEAKATAAHAAALVDLGVRAVVVAGSTGEATALTADERSILLAEVRAAVPEVPVLAGTGAAYGRAAAELTRRARDEGADGVLVLAPPRVEDTRPYYAQVAEAAGDLPLLAYHYPAVAPPGIALEHLDELPITGLKDSTGDPDRLLAELGTFQGALYVGSSALLALAGPMGVAGAILALANVDPERCSAAFGGDPLAQRELGPAHLAAKRRFPHGLKALMAQRFGTPAGVRLG
jgi:4-hydroxy-tetrahydrodipicolinate synthase